MKTRFLLLTVMSLTFITNIVAQDKYDDMVNVGDELVIGSPSSNDYKFIDIPKKNFIIKKGGIAKMTSIYKNKVTVTKVTWNKNNDAIVTLKRSNGSKFFNAYRTLKADLNGAIVNGELRFKDSSKTGAIAK